MAPACAGGTEWFVLALPGKGLVLPKYNITFRRNRRDTA